MQRNLVSEASPEDDSNLILSSDLDSSFDQLLSSFKSACQGREITETFNGDLLLDHYYTISSTKLNSLLFNPRTRFWHALSRIQGTVGFQAEDWTSESNGEVLKRFVTYQKAAQPPLLLKPVNVEEEQTYAGIENETFTILCSVRTPDVLLGNSFKTELLYSISPGPDLAEEQKTSHLVITWRIKFSKGTIFESMIRDSARKGLKSSFGQFSELLGRNAELIELKDLGAKLQMLASVEPDFESSWRMAMKSFANPTFIFSVLGIDYILVHVAKANARVIQGLEFPLFDLPDSIGELVFPVVLTLLGERALGMVSRFLAARRHQASDHGVRAHGKGWMLTVALLEGSNLDAVDSTESDPYVVFTCNGQSKISSIKFLTLKPQWNEIFSFDAMDGAPALMEVDLYGSSGLHKETALLGHTEVNFLSSKLSDLADMWVSLTRNVVLAGKSHLHLRIFIENNKGTDIVREHHEKLEREVGRKVSINSAQKNAAFQMHFGLPQEEFLIKDFKCELRKEGTIKFVSASPFLFH
ncbi:C2 and GRAM domain-containing protein [Rhynchospora pubera]|uniref:C2 and GRAM domain-containing protein n=1 Tax=Rhynchospora pubera TaxID=906938 RepID=A0AAV8FPV1_9POAL|nr:C2 and GRAM domain-containing protein [Rhynchospora pubera]